MKKSASEITRENFKEAMFSLYEDRPLKDISVNLLCKTAGYHRNTFYLYYSDIIDLLHEIDQDLLGSLWQHIVAYLNADLNADDQILPEVTEFFQNNRHRFEIMLRSDDHFQHKLVNLLREEFYQPNDPLVKIYRSEYTIAALFQLITLWFQRKQDLPVQDLLRLVKEIDSTYLNNSREESLKR